MLHSSTSRIFVAALLLGLASTSLQAQDAAAASAPASTAAEANATVAPASAAAPAAPLAAAAATESVDNPYGLDALWKGGDVVAKATLAILLIMSVGSWYVLFTKLWEQTRLNRQGRRAAETFWSAGAVPEAIETLEEISAYRFIARAGADATERHRGLHAHINLNEWTQVSIQRAIDAVQSRLQSGLAFLATVGSTAPFVGLFGTVWGIYHALTAIGIAGQASIDKVAGPVGEALIMTAIGLAVAVPAVLGYNWLVRRNKSALEQVRNFGSELHAVLLGAQAARPVEVPSQRRREQRSATAAAA
ncbi:MAG: MotA/TolQ/ExbB proton channel family protein [Gammaproteobacteria bacterium]|nr:MotA/TolQ/ExbB proton channel family protein [Gammaproteobacteria bacterium]